MPTIDPTELPNYNPQNAIHVASIAICTALLEELIQEATTDEAVRRAQAETERILVALQKAGVRFMLTVELQYVMETLKTVRSEMMEEFDISPARRRLPLIGSPS